MRGLKSPGGQQGQIIVSRIAHAVRGLKCKFCFAHYDDLRSHRSRGAWIEIYFICNHFSSCMSHRSRGAWIEIQALSTCPNIQIRRIAHAVRGLKYRFPPLFEEVKSVASLTRCVD